MNWLPIVGMVLATLFTSLILHAYPSNASSVYNRSVCIANVQKASPPSVAPTATKHPLGLIGIVAGHKGNDSSAVCPDGLTEASVNLDIAKRVKSGLKALGYLVGYDALAVVSIHNDSCVYINDEVTGFKVAGAVNTDAR